MTYETNQLNQVIDLLKEGTDFKQLDKGTEEAIVALRKAEAIIDECALAENDIPDPWPQLVQYRLAHLLLRNAGEDIELLQDIDQLLVGATQANCLGPLPRLYRLAVMHRLGKKPDKMKTIFEKLIKQIDNYDNEIDNYDTDDSITEKLAAYETATALQSNFFNMIELASYFTGYPYSGFEGVGRTEVPFRELTIDSLGKKHGLIEDRNPFYDLLYKLKSWHLIGTVSGLSTKEYPGEIAISELEYRMNNNEIKPPCIAFKISEDEKIHHWNFNLEKDDNGYVWKKVEKNSRHLRFLASIYKFKHFHNKSNVLYEMFNYDGASESNKLRKWKERCSSAIIDKFSNNKYVGTQLTRQNLFRNENVDESATSQFREDISILGAADFDLRYGVTRDDTI